MQDTIRMFIGTSANGEDADAEMVYQESLRQHLSGSLDITWMRLNNDPDSIWGEWNTSRWPTPFSGFRWAIPEACGFKGRAIYTDVDMINFRDIRELWNTDMQGKSIMARRGKRFGGHEFCVMLIDCEKLGELLMPVSRMKVLPDTHFRYIQQFSGNSEYVGDLDSCWNVLDGEDYQEDDMWILHFTCMGSQPWSPAWYRGPAMMHKRPELCNLWRKMRDELNAENAPKQRPNIDYAAYGQYNILGQ